MRKEMGEGKKKEKNRAKGSKAFIRKYFIKKKRLHNCVDGGSETDIAVPTVEMEKKNNKSLITHNFVWCRSVGI